MTEDSPIARMVSETAERFGPLLDAMRNDAARALANLNAHFVAALEKNLAMANAEPKRVLVTGSRDWPDPSTVINALHRAQDELGPIVVVHGACPTGADAIASQWARAYATEEAHPAHWHVGRKAGPERNARMVALGADLCLAFIFNRSRGATGCARLAEQAGIPVVRHWQLNAYLPMEADDDQLW